MPSLVCTKQALFHAACFAVEDSNPIRLGVHGNALTWRSDTSSGSSLLPLAHTRYSQCLQMLNVSAVFFCQTL